MVADPLFAENLAALPDISHAFFPRDWGNAGLSDEQHRSEVLQNRAIMAEKLGVQSDHLLTCYQTHSMDVVTVTQIWQPDDRPRADAMVTDVKGVALGVLTADCVPVLFADPKAMVIGAAHAGWRGAIGGILENTLKAMEELGASRNRIIAALGPCIWEKSYEVGPEFPGFFLTESPKNKGFFRPSFKSDHYQFDLPGYVVQKLRELNLTSIAHSPADTCADPERFFSHRYSTIKGEKRAGNLMSAIALMET
jgi:YfiH family protein